VLHKKGYIPVNAKFATTAEGIYAIGDAIAGPMLAHKAEEEGVACVEQIVTGYGHVNYDAIPGVVYTDPEIASVGQTEEQLKEAGIDYRKGSFPFRGNGRARTLGQVEGFVKSSRTRRQIGFWECISSGRTPGISSTRQAPRSPSARAAKTWHAPATSTRHWVRV
jgi:pyruvate/2-oxoglutarate dehydrogenase complex dihydrolipoamide dehydrogenase (E3) component